MTMEQYGWNTDWEQRRQTSSFAGDNVARVTQVHKSGCRIQTESGERRAMLAARILNDDPVERPAVGDWVCYTPLEQDEALILDVLSRSSQISRKASGRESREQVLAANVDWVFLVSSLNDDFNLNRLECYLTMAWQSGATPVVLLTKADLCDSPESYSAQVEALATEVAIMTISAVDGTGLESLSPFLQAGKTLIMVGSSGVGKSTLLNALLGEERQQTGNIRDSDQKGKHTTTHRELYRLPGGALVIDTPGLRELQLWGVESLEKTFPKIEALAEGCRFSDCHHENEPGCKLQAALASGDLDPRRYANYLKLRGEIRYLERKRQTDGPWRERQRLRDHGKMIKEAQRVKKNHWEF